MGVGGGWQSHHAQNHLRPLDDCPGCSGRIHSFFLHLQAGGDAKTEGISRQAGVEEGVIVMASRESQMSP